MFMEKYYSLFVFKIFHKSKSFFFDLGTFDILIYYQLKLLFLKKLIASLCMPKVALHLGEWPYYTLVQNLISVLCETGKFKEI